MARMPRGIELDKQGVYHLRAQVAGPQGYYPLQEEENARELIRIIRHYVGLYFCEAAGFEIMGSHYHLPVSFEPYRELAIQDLIGLAERFYPGTYRPYQLWGKKEWRVFNRRVFHVSELMRNVGQAFTRWYNRRHGRKGSFWADRFRSSETQDLESTVYYVELNAVRAGLVSRPEQWRYGSAWMREHGEDGWLMPLEKLVQARDRAKAEELYWTRLYWCGTRPSKETDAVIPVELALEMEQKMFVRGCFLNRYEAFSRGQAIGNREAIQARLQACRETRIYQQRRNPIPLGVGGLYALRPQRSSYLRV